MTITTTITSIDHFNEIVREIRSRRAYTIANGLPHRHEYYRGQLDAAWDVEPSVVRGIKDMGLLKKIETEVMQLFKSEIISNCPDKIFLHDKPMEHQNEWMWLSQAQHLRIPTRLLDWTLKPEVALYFSIDDPEYDHVDGQVLVMYVPHTILRTDGGNPPYYTTHYQDMVDTWFLNPAFYDGYRDITAEVRRARQHGKFSLQGYDKAIKGFNNQDDFLRQWKDTFDPVIEKYIIPSEIKKVLRDELHDLGWVGEYLYHKEDEELNLIVDKCKELRNDIIKGLK